MSAVLCAPRQTSAAAVAAFEFRRGLRAQPFHLISCPSGGFALDVAGS